MPKRSDIKRDNRTDSFGYKYSEEFDQNKFSTKLEIRDIGIIERLEITIDTEKYVPDKNYSSLEYKAKDFRENLFRLGIRQRLQQQLRQESQIDNRINTKDVLFKHVEEPSTRILEIEQRPMLALPAPRSEIELQHTNTDQQQFPCFSCQKLVHRGCPYCPSCGQKFSW